MTIILSDMRFRCLECKRNKILLRFHHEISEKFSFEDEINKLMNKLEKQHHSMHTAFMSIKHNIQDSSLGCCINFYIRRFYCTFSCAQSNIKIFIRHHHTWHSAYLLSSPFRHNCRVLKSTMHIGGSQSAQWEMSEGGSSTHRFINNDIIIFIILDVSS